jgi:hypothetical protein
MAVGEYYALYIVHGEGKSLALLDAGEDERGHVPQLAVYTSPESEAARSHLEAFSVDVAAEDFFVEPVSARDLLAALQPGGARSVVLDGGEVDATVFRMLLENELAHLDGD